MALTLSDCFECAGIDITHLNAESMQEVKKILLLELKSTGGDTLLIGDAQYTKNDIVQFFEYGNMFPDSTLASYEINYKSIVWHQVLAHPEKLDMLFEMPDELLDRDRLEEVRVLVERQYGKEIIRTAQRQFRDGEFDRLQFLISYAPVFSSTFSYELKQSLMLLLKNKLLKIENDTRQQTPILNFHALPFFNKGFYQTIHFLKDMDGDLTRQIMRVAVDRCRGQYLAWLQKRELFEMFYFLPMDSDSLAYIEKNLQYFDDRIREEQSGATSVSLTNTATANTVTPASQRTGTGIRLIVAICLLILGGWVVYIAYSKTDDKPETEMTAQDLAIEDQYKDHYFDAKDIVKDYEKLKKGIISNVSNPEVRGFLINQLSRFAYDQDVDTSHTMLAFEPVKPLPGCVPMTFSNDSRFSEVLVLIYNEENPESHVRGAVIPRNRKYEDATLYIFPTDRVIVLFNPLLKDESRVITSRVASTDVFNVLFESYRLKSATPKKDVYLSVNEYTRGTVSMTHIYETMQFRRLHRNY